MTLSQEHGRCPWCGTDPLYVAYHDTEWGRAERDPRALWELLMLEAFQAGLSWYTILKKRENFRAAFAGFDPAVIALWGAPEVDRLLQDAGIIRHRGKIEGTIRSAKLFLEIESAEGFTPYLWGFVGGKPVQNGWTSMGQVPAATDESTAMSKALKKRGFTFCGPVICYAFMQATGMVNDHITSCHCHDRVKALSAG